MVAMSLTALLVVAAMVLDFGLVRMDRQINKAAADSASISGVQVMVDSGNDKVYPFRGACGALRFLRANHAQLGSLSGSWTKGDGSAIASVDPCASSAPEQTLECVANSSVTWARFHGTVGDFEVDIHGGYKDMTGYTDEAHVSGDPSQKGGCDQVAVMIKQVREPGLGSLATSGQLGTDLRSVGRINPPGPPEDPIALLLLEQHNCLVLDIEGTNAKILVKAVGNTPGRIHSDSMGDGTDCSTGSQIMNGDFADGIIAEESPVRPGAITLYALSGVLGANPLKAYDDPPDVISEGQVGDKPIPGRLQTRRIPDSMYRLGVINKISGAYGAKYWWSKTVDPAAGEMEVTDCSTAGAVTAAMKNHTGTLFFNCSESVKYGAAMEFKASRVVINTGVKLASGDLSFPNAKEVYVRGKASPLTGLDIGGNKFQMNHAGMPTACADGNQPGRSALMVVGYGGISATNNSLLQLCNTAVILMGDGPVGTGCVPGTDGTAPVGPPTACVDAVVNAQGGTIEWTAPDEVDAGPESRWYSSLEDLALWTEAPSNSHGVGGGSYMHLAGVFMLPNADYFKVTGGGSQNVRNSQYIARRFLAAGNGTLEMAPNPDDSVKTASPPTFSLVR